MKRLPGKVLISCTGFAAVPLSSSYDPTVSTLRSPEAQRLNARSYPFRHPAECNKMQQQKRVHAAQCNKIHQLEQWFFCSLLRATIMQHLFTFVASSIVRVVNKFEMCVQPHPKGPIMFINIIKLAPSMSIQDKKGQGEQQDSRKNTEVQYIIQEIKIKEVDVGWSSSQEAR